MVRRIGAIRAIGGIGGVGWRSGALTRIRITTNGEGYDTRRVKEEAGRYEG